MDDAAPIGHNRPPVELADPFDAIKLHIDDLYLEIGNWADGQEIETDDQAGVVDRLLADVGEAIKAADAARDAFIDPLNAQVKLERERWWPLTGDTTKVTGTAIRAKRALLAVKGKWADKVRARQAAEAERLRKEAAEKAAAAQAVLRDGADNLASAVVAEDLIRDAKSSLAAAKAAEKVAPKGMRTVWTTVMSDKVLGMRTMLARHPDEMEAYAQQLAERDVREGKRELPGFTITQGQEAFR